MGFRDLNERAAKALMVAGALWSAGLAFYILIDVVCRALGIRGIPGTAEIARNSIVVIVFMQLPYCVLSRGMLNADFLVNWFPPGLQRALRICGYAVGAVLFLAIAVGSWHPTAAAWMSSAYDGDGAFRVPLWPVRAAVLLGCALSAVAYLVLIWEEAREQVGKLAAAQAAQPALV
jgi:TRAP-type C4-dicarboxylate transport system permease small subunit